MLYFPHFLHFHYSISGFLPSFYMNFGRQKWKVHFITFPLYYVFFVHLIYCNFLNSIWMNILEMIFCAILFYPFLFIFNLLGSRFHLLHPPGTAPTKTPTGLSRLWVQLHAFGYPAFICTLTGKYFTALRWMPSTEIRVFMLSSLTTYVHSFHSLLCISGCCKYALNNAIPSGPFPCIPVGHPTACSFGIFMNTASTSTSQSGGRVQVQVGIEEEIVFSY